ncbi:MAG: spiro-SPASM protein, partial [Spirochaetae bacterium HGW-Spirochaetae-7]
METLAIINATHVNEFATVPFAAGPSALERVLALVRATLGGSGGDSVNEGILVLGTSAAADPGVAMVRGDDWTMRGVLAEAARFAASRRGADTVLYLQADAPFTDAALTAQLLLLHRRYRAEYTFADGYPPGFAPEVLASKALPNLVELAGRFDAPSERDGLFKVIQKDINSYDIETQLSPVDLRGYRFSPVCDSRRNALSAERLWALGARSAEDVTRLLPAHPELLRTVPAFMWVQVVDGCPQSCSYCPYPAMVGDPRALRSSMPVDRFASIMAQAESLCDDLVVDVSLWGEPSLHPDFRGLADTVLAHPRFTLVVETSGLGWEPGLAEELASAAGARIQWIVSLDDADADGYLAIRGDGFDAAAGFADRMMRASPGNVHAQAVRMKDNEARLEIFYRAWKKRGERVIIQKYDSFAGSLPDRTVAALSPLDRLPCRHLARDMAVMLDGGVPPCKHCLVSDRKNSRLAYAQV